jgi:hypothetical protein
MPPSIQHGRSANHTLRIVCPNGHLGFAPIKTGSFQIGCHCEPDLICADSGSCDVGPVPLGADISSSPLQWQVDDLETMLLASRRLGVPMIVGSAGDTGSNSRVDLFVGIIRDLATKHELPRFRVGYFYSEVSKDALRRRIVDGDEIVGLDARPPLDLATLNATERIVAVAGVHGRCESTSIARTRIPLLVASDRAKDMQKEVLPSPACAEVNRSTCFRSREPGRRRATCMWRNAVEKGERGASSR